MTDQNNLNGYSNQNNYNSPDGYNDQNYNNYNNAAYNQNQNTQPHAVNLRKPQNNNSQPNNDMQFQALNNEYQTDREYIHKAISDALKENNVSEAMAFIDKYRPVAGNDPVFNELISLAEQSIKKNEIKSRLLIRLDSTPDNDYKSRAEIYQQLLQQEPNNVEYAQAFDNCLNRLPLSVKNQILGINQNNSANQGAQNSSNADDKPKPFMSVGAAIASGFYCIIAFFGVIVLLMEFDPFALSLVVTCIIAFLMLTNLKFNPLKDFPTVAKICIAFMTWITLLITGAALFIDETEDSESGQSEEITAPEQVNPDTTKAKNTEAGTPVAPKPTGSAVPAN